MSLWGAAAFASTLALAVYDAQFTCTSLERYGTVAELNPGVRFAAKFGRLGIYTATILPTVVLLATVTLAQSGLGLGIILGIRLCLFRFQRLALRLRSHIAALNSSQRLDTPPPASSDAS